MLTKALSAGVLGCGLLLASGTSTLAASKADACAREAASSWQDGYPQSGKELYQINERAALAACGAALKAEPSSVDVMFWFARAYYANRQFDKARELLEPAARAGHVPAMHLLGVLIHDKEKSAAPELKRGAELLKAAVDAGYVPALSDYGYALEKGLGVQADPAAALKSYRRAADAGYPGAITQMGFAYVDAVGTAEDPKESTRWFTKAAKLGEPAGIASLAYNLMEGYGIAEDDVHAAELFEQALALGHAAAATNLGFLYETGAGVAKDLKRAAAYYERGVGLGDGKAMDNLARMYLHGRGVEVDGQKAIALAEKALAAGQNSAFLTLGDAYTNGAPGVESNKAKGMDYFEQGVAAGETDAMVSLGHWLAESEDRAKHKRAFDLNMQAAQQNNAQAMGNLAYHYMEGAGVGQDFTKAVEWARKGADLGSATAQGNLGELYERGVGGLHKDLSRARELYGKAIAQGEKWVETNLSRLNAGTEPPPLPMHKQNE